MATRKSCKIADSLLTVYIRFCPHRRVHLVMCMLATGSHMSGVHPGRR